MIDVEYVLVQWVCKLMINKKKTAGKNIWLETINLKVYATDIVIP